MGFKLNGYPGGSLRISPAVALVMLEPISAMTDGFQQTALACPHLLSVFLQDKMPLPRVSRRFYEPFSIGEGHQGRDKLWTVTPVLA